LLYSPLVRAVSDRLLGLSSSSVWTVTFSQLHPLVARYTEIVSNSLPRNLLLRMQLILRTAERRS
jgi:hypothetical protein